MSKRSHGLLRIGSASVRERRVQAARVGRGVERAVVGGDLREAGGVTGDGAVEGGCCGVVAGRDEREEKEEVARLRKPAASGTSSRNEANWLPVVPGFCGLEV